MIFEVKFRDKICQVAVEAEQGKFLVTIQKKKFLVDAIFMDSCLSLFVGERSYHLAVTPVEGDHYVVQWEGKLFPLHVLSEEKKLRALLKKTKPLASPVIQAKMPGKIVKILASVGERVAADQGVLIMEAMKMENELRAPIEGKIKEIRVKEGESVEAGAILAVLES